MNSRGQSWCHVPGSPVFPWLCCKCRCAMALQLPCIPAAGNSAEAECVPGRVVLIDLFNIFACQALEMQNAVFHSVCHLLHTILK